MDKLPAPRIWRKALSLAWIGITLGLVSLSIRLLGIPFGQSIWQAYFPVFKALRYVQDLLLSWVPFPLVYIWFPLLVAYLLYRVRKWWLRRKSPSAEKPTSARFRFRFLRKLANLAGAIFFLFNILWGFNYLHNPLSGRLPHDRPVLSAEALCFEAEWAVRNAEIARARIPGIQADSLLPGHLPAEHRAWVSKALTQLLDSLQLPQAVSAEGRQIHPEGFLLRAGISGIYNPFTGEGNIDAGMATAFKPAVLAHEMSHGKGYTDEGTCNFLGILACLTADDPMLQYSGYLTYYLYLAGDLYQADPELQRLVRGTLDDGLAADLRANRNTHLRYSGWLAKVGESVNHAYLSTQGISGGITNYGKVVAYMMAFKVSRHLGSQRRSD